MRREPARQLAGGNTAMTAPIEEMGSWGPAFDQLREWDPDWAQACLKVTTDPWTNGILPLATVELICIAVNAACTNLQADATRRHIRAALAAGATREEILMVLKMAGPAPVWGQPNTRSRRDSSRAMAGSPRVVC
jgi:alkylhydroperoxidase/carboxymuconolactone decarboxylase family protein YurZ